MSLLSPRLQLKVAQKQVLTPGLVQMVTVLQLNRLELREMIQQEMSANPILEETLDAGEELTPEEVQALLEAERVTEVSDQELLAVTREPSEVDEESTALESTAGVAAAEQPEPQQEAADPFDQIDFDDYFDRFLDPGHKSPAGENVEKPSFEAFLSAPVTLSEHLRSQLALVVLSETVREAADAIIGNLDESGYLTTPIEEIASFEDLPLESLEEALAVVQTLDPAGVGARDLRECLLLQLKSRGAEGGVAWTIVHDYLKLVETKQFREIAKQLKRPLEHVQISLALIGRLDPSPGSRYSGSGAQKIEPDVYIFKDGDDYRLQLNDDDVPQLKLNADYRRMLDREQEPNKDIRNYVRDRYASALQLIKNIEQRRQTIMRVCMAVIERQREFLENGIDQLRPMMIKDVAEEIGVHPSTVSRAVAGKYAHTPQGVYELRFFFSEAVQGPSGTDTPLLVLKRRVKQMIEEEDARNPLTDEQITARLNEEGIHVTRRTVAKYREDMRIPSTHQRRVRP